MSVFETYARAQDVVRLLMAEAVNHADSGRTGFDERDMKRWVEIVLRAMHPKIVIEITPGDYGGLAALASADIEDMFVLMLAAQKSEIELLRAAVRSLGDEIVNEHSVRVHPGDAALREIDIELGQ